VILIRERESHSKTVCLIVSEKLRNEVAFISFWITKLNNRCGGNLGRVSGVKLSSTVFYYLCPFVLHQLPPPPPPPPLFFFFFFPWVENETNPIFFHKK
jgi:hypothetical protein